MMAMTTTTHHLIMRKALLLLLLLTTMALTSVAFTHISILRTVQEPVQSRAFFSSQRQMSSMAVELNLEEQFYLTELAMDCSSISVRDSNKSIQRTRNGSNSLVGDSATIRSSNSESSTRRPSNELERRQRLLPEPDDMQKYTAAATAFEGRQVDSSEEAEEEAYQVATDLLNALIDPRRTPNKILKIQSLMNRLTTSKENHPYDPVDCLFGPYLYCTLFSYNPGNPTAEPPLWEKVLNSRLKQGNIKGQQCENAAATSTSASASADSSSSSCATGSVINYNEIWGPAVHVRAKGVLEPTMETDGTRRRKKTILPSNQLVLDHDHDNWFGRRRTIRSCPDVYKVKVTEASVHVDLWGAKLGVHLPIKEEKMLVVLYADPRLRILLNSQSIIATQVRSDLCLPVLCSKQPMDLCCSKTTPAPALAPAYTQPAYTQQFFFADAF
jgi:hypothetical protein